VIFISQYRRIVRDYNQLVAENRELRTAAKEVIFICDYGGDLDAVSVRVRNLAIVLAKTGDRKDDASENAWLRAEVKRLEEWVDDLQSRMHINCVYCGRRYTPADEEPEHDTMREELKAHVVQCKKHPMAAMAVALRSYLKAQCRMLEHWAEGDAAVREKLWHDLHACEDSARKVLDQ
jgi:hypothetical protein